MSKQPRSDDDRIWAKITIDLLSSRKVVMEPAAKWLYVASILTSRRDLTDGHVRGPAVAFDQDVDPEMIEVLVHRGLWHRAGHDCPDCPQPEVGHGWVYIHDYLRHQPSRAEIEGRREALAEYGRKGARKRWGKAEAMAEAMATPMADPMATPNGQQHGQHVAETETETELLVTSVASSSSASSRLSDDELAKISELCGGGPAHARKTAEFILAKSPRDVHDPLAYVLRAVGDDPQPYRYRRGNPRKGQDCPRHVGEWADACRACVYDPPPPDPADPADLRVEPFDRVTDLDLDEEIDRWVETPDDADYREPSWQPYHPEDEETD